MPIDVQPPSSTAEGVVRYTDNSDDSHHWLQEEQRPDDMQAALRTAAITPPVRA